jgi:biopolymer transport protein ExbD
VDVVLVLLIIFMAAAPLIHRRAMNVNVPRAAHHEPKATDTLQIQFTAQSEILMEDKKYSLPELEQALSRRFRLDPALHVSVAAEKTVPYGNVVELLDAVRAAGVKKLALEVRRK